MFWILLAPDRALQLDEKMKTRQIIDIIPLLASCFAKHNIPVLDYNSNCIGLVLERMDIPRAIIDDSSNVLQLLLAPAGKDNGLDWGKTGFPGKLGFA